MQSSGHTVLITGGASGIGLGIASHLLEAGNQVIVCGRDPSKLAIAAHQYPGLITYQVDIAFAAGRSELIAWVVNNYSGFDVLVNNAGIQRRQGFENDTASWDERAEEIAINFEAPAHLIALVQPHFLKQKAPTIINISSKLAFFPAPFAPIYAASKAALHSLSMSLRAEYALLGIEMIVIVPPIVNTDLGGIGLHDNGVPVAEFVKATMARIARGDIDIDYDNAFNASVT